MISTLVSERRQRLGDLLANTLVVYSAQKELASQYFYISQEDYQWFLELASPPLFKREIAQAYLRVAYPHFIARTRIASPATLAQWLAHFQSVLPVSKNWELDETSLLMYFAEHCQQSLKILESKKKNH